MPVKITVTLERMQNANRIPRNACDDGESGIARLTSTDFSHHGVYCQCRTGDAHGVPQLLIAHILRSLCQRYGGESDIAPCLQRRQGARAGGAVHAITARSSVAEIDSAIHEKRLGSPDKEILLARR